ncbi:hypothetical protein RFI_35159, partial [Reticulomyxa filosa]
KLKSAQELDSRIQSIEDEIKMKNTDFEKKQNNFDKEIQRIDEEISKLMGIKQNYQLLIKKSRKNKSPQKATDFLKQQGYVSIGQVEEQEKQVKAESETLKKKKELEKTHIEKLGKSLKEYQQIQKEFRQLQKKKKVILENVSEFLKNRDFLDSEISRLANNENELIERIGKYEREIDNIKGVGYIFHILNASRAEKVLHYLKKCKETTFSFTDIVTVNDQSERNQSGEKNQSTLRQNLATTLCLMERYLQCYGEFVQNQLRWLDYTEISSLNTDTNEFVEKVEVIVSRLYEINKLEKNHPVIFAFFPQDMMKQFHSKLENIWWNLSDDIMNLEKQSNLPALKSKLLVTKALSTLDEHTKSNCKFRDLFVKHQEALFNNVIDTGKVLKAMDEHRYIDVTSEMSKINQRKDGDAQVERVFEELKNSLSRSLRALAKTTMMKVLTLGDNEVDLKNVIDLEAQLQAIEDAKKYVLEYVGENTMKEIEKIESETKSSIERWLSN